MSTPPTPATPPAPAVAPAEYVLGTDAEEEVRLGLQHRLWSAQAFAAWEKAGIGPGTRVLDVGCGPGYAMADLCQLVGPTGRVVGIDVAPGFVAAAQARCAALANATAVEGDVHTLASLGEGAFDAAFARWVLCFLPEPERAIAVIAQRLRPGGRLCIQDYFNYEAMTLAPKREAFSRGIRAVGRSWRDRGGSPDFAGQLPAMLRRAGLRLDHLSANQRLARPGEPIWKWPDSFWKSFVPRLVAGGYLAPADRDEFFAAWAGASADPDSFMLLPTVFDAVATRI